MMDDIATVSIVSIELARFLGFFLTILGFGIAINSNHMLKIAHDMPQNHGMQLTAAIFPALLGSWIIAVHNQCANNWSCIITTIGWLMIVAAFFRAWFPTHWANTVQKLANKVLFQVFGSVLGLIGAYLLYKGWIDPS